MNSSNVAKEKIMRNIKLRKNKVILHGREVATLNEDDIYISFKEDLVFCLNDLVEIIKLMHEERRI